MNPDRQLFGFPLWAWGLFMLIVGALLVFDLVHHRRDQKVSHTSALIWTIIWIAAGVAFGGFVWWKFGQEIAADYFAVYLLEKSLSLDNLFLFLLIFTTLKVPEGKQRTVLLWGILGAIIFRGLFIFLGVQLLERWEWLTYLFAAILLWAAIHAFREDPAKRRVSKPVDWLSQKLPVTKKSEGFIRREGGRFLATPLLLALITIELSDIMFAIDSVAAALALTRRPFVLYSANIFAILGMRALYILMAKTLKKLRYLHYGLAAVLAFAALKMIAARWVKVPPLVSMAIIVVIIAAAAWASLAKGRGEAKGR